MVLAEPLKSLTLLMASCLPFLLERCSSNFILFQQAVQGKQFEYQTFPIIFCSICLLWMKKQLKHASLDCFKAFKHCDSMQAKSHFAFQSLYVESVIFSFLSVLLVSIGHSEQEI